MLVQFFGSYPLQLRIRFSLKVNGTCLWNFLRIPSSASLNLYRNLWKVPLELLGPLFPHSFKKSLLKQLGHAPNVSWVNYFQLPHWIAIKNQWTMLMEFIGPSPLHSVKNPNWKSMDNVLAASWTISFTFLYKALIKMYGTCSECFLDQFLQYLLLNHH